mmetsp:Transcript_37815/g.79728  ORF Transcript_37815/g.79728 Transcript_37815/m.79728 type:complete len:328 (+) Transcript_37815:346-1329(+)|eukprot:CAMPEP_0183736346 /NCGR_PEP_ID=MMETSP0737-20130205/49044_1 /TAXON_ID=385413 /ORGANISM="Thalassiosira miniscula, Strain CCMP1093" /LENGTH=327 /DNA_ID=CAMNT_0025970315 /DNA_START=303 /DNA_END=1286 /DNA_ORIENTATION=-
MGNCINRSSSSTATSTQNQNYTKHDGDGGTPCDDRTVSSSNATSSPPASPLAKINVVAENNRHPNLPSPQTSPSSLSISTGANTSAMEQQREEGQKRLRELVVSGAEAGNIDWSAVIALAEELHNKEQQLLRFGNNLPSSSSSGGGSSPKRNISRKQAFFEKRRRKREVTRRRKLESVGSFSVNLYLYEDNNGQNRRDEKPDDLHTPTKINENDESQESSLIDDDDDPDDDRVDIFEDDDPSPFDHDTSDAMPAMRAATETETRPGTPFPFKPKPIYLDTGSFLAATSLLGSGHDDESLGSDSSTSTSQGKTWDLITIDEEATVTNW